MHKKECIAMLLAGGQGSRLGALTKSVAKPAVSFGGKYRIIDFSLSNCVNSGIDTVGILIQYKPLVLNHYVGTGEAWDLDIEGGGVHILPPYATEKGGEWYNGTADAIYHNIDFIDSYDPEFVLVLSGDHLYKMDYNRMLTEHKKNNADLTVSVMQVPMEEACRFGIMSVDEKGRITKFSEKPKKPESNLASMGIYIFSWDTLRKALLKDHEDENSDRDFGKNVIPALLNSGKRLFAYEFSGYWKDVGTITSYYNSQMDLIDKNSGFDIYDEDMKIFSNSNIYPPHFIEYSGSAENSLICNGCSVAGKVCHSILSSAVKIGEESEIYDSILLPNVTVGRNCRLSRVIVNENIRIKDGSVIGSDDGEITVIDASSSYAEN